MGSQTPPAPFNLAIIGGGISGCILSIALLKHHIPHTIYESAAKFGEIGAGVGFCPTFVRTMGLIAPEIREAFLRCSEVGDVPEEGKSPEGPVFFTVRVGDLRRADDGGGVDGGEGEGSFAWKDGKEGRAKVGEKLFDWPARSGESGGVHRAHFLDELVKLIPAENCRFKKKLVDVKEADDGSGDAVLYFADGSEARHSAVIGCDGIKSRTRELVLGKEEARPVFTGKVAYRGLLPMEKAREIMGKEVDTMQAQMYLGYHGHILMYPVAHGSILNIVAVTAKESWNDNDWIVLSSREDMLSDYSTWTPTIRALLSEIRKPDMWATFHHNSAPTYVQARPRICLVGDAAHASSQHQGAGAGMGIEDCYILAEILGQAPDLQDLDKVFRVYDEVRRPRSLKLVETSEKAGKLFEFEGPEGDDIEAIEQNLRERMSWLWDWDMSGDLKKAKSIMQGAV